MGTLDWPELKKMPKLCAGKVSILLHPSLYSALKLTFPRDVDVIVLDGRITSEMNMGSLGQSVVAHRSAYFHPVCV